MPLQYQALRSYGLVGSRPRPRVPEETESCSLCECPIFRFICISLLVAFGAGLTGVGLTVQFMDGWKGWGVFFMYSGSLISTFSIGFLIFVWILSPEQSLNQAKYHKVFYALTMLQLLGEWFLSIDPNEDSFATISGDVGVILLVSGSIVCTIASVLVLKRNYSHSICNYEELPQEDTPADSAQPPADAPQLDQAVYIPIQENAQAGASHPQVEAQAGASHLQEGAQVEASSQPAAAVVEIPATKKLLDEAAHLLTDSPKYYQSFVSVSTDNGKESVYASTEMPQTDKSASSGENTRTPVSRQASS